MSKPLILNAFYGYPACIIAQWCAVDKKTAERWKRGTQRPTQAHLKLFHLHADQRICPEGWGYNMRTGELFTPENDCFPLVSLRCHVMLWELRKEYCMDIQDTQLRPVSSL